ncbi:MAG: C4-dicarboxylate TRAP transporter substrate-binding protein [Proteobacteria bacterium]|nr:C4-dicarboxylate TRAP transporter substrate-binding protein [Pseudomonadota bacterium]
MQDRGFVRRAARVCAFVAACAVASTVANAQQVIKLTLATGLPPTLFVQKEASDTFAPAVNEELKKAGNEYQIEWTIGHAGTIVRLPGMMQAITDGVVDVGVTTQALEQSKMPLQNVVYYVPFGTTDHRVANDVFARTQRDVPAMNVWSKLNAVYLAGFPFDRYILMAKTPIRSVDDLKGRKVGGIGPNLLWLQNTGGVGVIGTFATAYEDMQSGKYDVSFSTPTATAGIRLHEVAPYLIDVGFGSMAVQVALINKARFDKLPPPVQRALMLAAKRWEEANLKDLDARLEPAMRTMRDAGATIITFSEEERKRWADRLPPIALNWAAAMAKRGLPGMETVAAYMRAQRAHGVQFVRSWDKQ